MDLLTADAILGADDLETIDVEVPEWKGSVRLRALSAAEAIQFMDMASTPATAKNALVRIVQMSAVNADGTPLFTMQQLEKLKGKSLKALNRLQTAALKLNGLGKKAEEVEEEVKNA